jgi:TolB protein
VFADTDRPHEGDGYSLKVLDFDTGELREIARNVSYYPSWSPDGSQLVFADLFGETMWIINADGTDRRVLTEGTLDRWPSWSPDGTRIAFIRDHYLHVMSIDGTAVKRLAGLGTSNYMPSWSPDGNRLTFHAGGGIFVIGADGTGLLRLTPNGNPDHGQRSMSGENPQWSPDGQWIAFTEINGGVWLVRPDGTGLGRIFDTVTTPHVSWSPDSRNLAFTAFDGGGGPLGESVYSVQVATGLARRLSPPGGGASPASPAWAPDSSFVVYFGFCDTTERFNLCRVDADGTGLRLLIDYVAGGRPAFAPSA